MSKTGYNSPKASKDKAMMESTNSKKKKYGSIIVQPERNSPVNNKSVGNYGPQFDDVRITEDDDFIMRTAEEINNERRSGPSSIVQAYQKAAGQTMSII